MQQNNKPSDGRLICLGTLYSQCLKQRVNQRKSPMFNRVDLANHFSFAPQYVLTTG